MSSNTIINLLDTPTIIKVLGTSGLALEHVSKEKMTKEMVIVALEQDINAFAFIRDFSNDKEVMLYVLSKTSLYNKDGLGIVPYITKEVLADRDIAIASIKTDPTANSFRFSAFTDDKEVAMLAISKNYKALDYVKKSSKYYRELALYACDCNINALNHTSNGLDESKDFIIAVLKQNPFAITYKTNAFQKTLDTLTVKDDLQVILEVVNYDVNLFKYLPVAFKNDKEVLKTMTMKNGLMLKYCPDKQRDDADFVAKAIDQNGFAFAFVSARLKNDKNLVIKALKTFKCKDSRKAILGMMSDELKKDMVFLKTLYDGLVHCSELIAIKKTYTLI